MNKEEIENKIKELQEQLKNIDKIDFSEFIGRSDDILAIKGETLLKSYKFNILAYNNLLRKEYKDKITYEVVNMSDLVKGDIFIDDDLEEKFELSDFKIYIGETDNRYFYQYLDKYGDLENITCDYWTGNFKVKRFLRE